jgi:hypothetical protein
VQVAVAVVGVEDVEDLLVVAGVAHEAVALLVG